MVPALATPVPPVAQNQQLHAIPQILRLRALPPHQVAKQLGIQLSVPQFVVMMELKRPMPLMPATLAEALLPCVNRVVDRVLPTHKQWGLLFVLPLVLMYVMMVLVLLSLSIVPLFFHVLVVRVLVA